MTILNEYVTNGREIKDTDKVVKYNNLDMTGNPNTIFNNYACTKQHLNLNDFNKEMHELLLQSNDIVNEYKAFASAELKNVILNNYDKINASVITLEDAKVIQLNNLNFVDIKSKVEKSCLSISKEVKRLSTKQTQIMNDIIKELNNKKMNGDN